MTKSAISSQNDKLMGSQSPSVRIAPAFNYSDGDDAVKILAVGRLIVDPWQENVLIDWMGKTEDDVWSAPTCGLSIPRQNGKTTDTCGRMAAGMIMYNEWIIYTAHLQKTATETFMELKGLFETPKLFKYVKEIKSALGREQIILKNGGRVQFVARTRNGGRGLHGDCLIFDEAQELNSEQQASFLPALAASSNPQTIYLGTPPDENCTGTVFRNIRNKALNGVTKTTAWTEYSVNTIGDIKNKARWAETNPALGRRIKETTIESECEQMDADTFARERLGWWAPVASENIDYAINKEKWMSCKSKQMKPTGRTAYGVKFSVDGTEVILCGAVIDENEVVRISEIERKPTSQGIRWLSDWLNERYLKASCVVIDGKNGADLLIDRISDTWKFKDSIIKPHANDIVSAASLLIDSINENKLTWYEGQEDLNDSAITATKRPIGGGFGLGGDNSLPIEAASLAFWGAKNTKRDPNKRMRIG